MLCLGCLVRRQQRFEAGSLVKECRSYDLAIISCTSVKWDFSRDVQDSNSNVASVSHRLFRRSKLSPKRETRKKSHLVQSPRSDSASNDNAGAVCRRNITPNPNSPPRSSFVGAEPRPSCGHYSDPRQKLTSDVGDREPRGLQWVERMRRRVSERRDIVAKRSRTLGGKKYQWVRKKMKARRKGRNGGMPHCRWYGQPLSRNMDSDW
jgi:hypothetical protein